MKKNNVKISGRRMIARVCSAELLRRQLADMADPEKAALQKRFFRTERGGYAESDIFWGIPVPLLRKIAHNVELSLPETEKLLADAVHEVRFLALLLMLFRFRNADAFEQKIVIDLYLHRTDCVNNWDLVDLSAPMLGEWLLDRSPEILYNLAKSSRMWDQRIALVANLPLIRDGNFAPLLEIGHRLCTHPHPLIQKALGWMLREIGKKDKAVSEFFLDSHLQNMACVTLRYATEHFSAKERKNWQNRRKKACTQL